MDETKQNNNDCNLDAVDILTHVTASLDYLEDVSEKRVSSLLTILHSEIDRALQLLYSSNQESLQCSESSQV